MARLRLIIFVLLALGVAVLPAVAQDGQPAAPTNLLQQPGFDDGYTNRGRNDLNVPGHWGLWIADGPREYEWQNRADKVFAFPHNSPPEVYSGNASLNLSGGWVTFTAAVFQQVAVPEGANLLGSAYAWLHTCNFGGGGACGSNGDSGAFVRVGIDPNGGVDPNDVDIVWSNNATPHDRWEQVSVSATATGPVATIFLYVTQNRPTSLNNVYWDHASLTIGGEGGSAPAAPGEAAAPAGPTARPTVPVPVVQDAQPDGSIVHVVQPGDTVDSIAMVYGVSRAQILALNDLENPRLIRIGDRILVRAAD